MFDRSRSPKPKPPKRHKTFSTFFSPSKRLTLTYIVLFVWIALAIFAIIMKADLYALAVYFTSGLPVILGYLWAQSSRPSLSEAAELVKGINRRPGQFGQFGYDQYGGGYGGYGGYGGGQFNNFPDQSNQNNNFGNQATDIDIDSDVVINIYSDDASAELKVNQSQLSTLKNLGYVDEISGKYTFKKNTIDQIKSLIIDKSTQDPDL
jgi:hypothetical protein